MPHAFPQTLHTSFVWQMPHLKPIHQLFPCKSFYTYCFFIKKILIFILRNTDTLIKNIRQQQIRFSSRSEYNSLNRATNTCCFYKIILYFISESICFSQFIAAITQVIIDCFHTLRLQIYRLIFFLIIFISTEYRINILLTKE